ncbi:bifunctional folylpolyglutamate synthase/dihydrofolate synthase [Aureimonas flava]|uniref:Dihydrofolate synthase/folylpolyglutamate synthase n=1 Tax=Aureimonas flava TaxID=2320271 RepID=A0A3A1WRG1_9HYPH|nr:folylpolyglutamate synthase/dihydrofolate synthase family protein [Aureimonas flava]RIY00738.1 bifunctional folylpolyglutamate synthase/dihydrofolate synthase [Aureimonas flava]
MSQTSLAAAEIDRLLQHLPKGIDLGLDRIGRLLAALGDPHRRLAPVIHVAGTNGKGSTVAFARAILEASGRGVHTHTSPHLVDWHERYRLAGTDGARSALVADALLAETVRRAAAANGDATVTVFELLTAVAFMLFSEHPADAVLLEVGLGGRFDATNVVERPAVTAVTSVSLDHQAYLGDRVELIAAEKAGIFKRGSPVVIGPQTEPAALEVLCDKAARTGAPVLVHGQDFHAISERGRLVYQDERGLLDLALPRLPGRHQIGNAATAIAAVRAAGFDPADAEIERGIAAAEWPGRLQRITSGPLVALAPDGAEIWLDGGHNPGAGVVVAEAMADMEERVPRPLILVAGMLTTKDPAGFFEAFAGMARHVFTVPIRSSDAGMTPEALADAALEAGLDAEPAPSVSAAIRRVASHWAGGAAPRFLICGSLYLAGDVLAESDLAPR